LTGKYGAVVLSSGRCTAIDHRSSENSRWRSSWVYTRNCSRPQHSRAALVSVSGARSSTLPSSEGSGADGNRREGSAHFAPAVPRIFESGLLALLSSATQWKRAPVEARIECGSGLAKGDSGSPLLEPPASPDRLVRGGA